MFEGLPTEWREVLELPPQSREVDLIDESLKINKDHLIIPESKPIMIYEVR
jgi:hypothetical protein